MGTNRRNPAVRRIETPHGGAYETPDGVFPRVTTILNAVRKQGLDYWIARVEREATIEKAGELLAELPRFNGSRGAFKAALARRLGRRMAFERVMAQAGGIGSEAHGLIEWHLRRELGHEVGPEPRVCESALVAFTAYQEWRRTVQLRPLAVEETVWSATHAYAGTMDLYAELVIDGVKTRTVMDWKTSSRIHPEARLQAAAYVHALIEMGKAEAPVDAVIIRLPKLAKGGEVETAVIPWEEHERLFEVFLAVQRVWEWMASGKRRAA